jgi:hypothetical protein
MNTFRYERLGFEISLPDEWHEAQSSVGGKMTRQVVFNGEDGAKRSIHIAVGALSRIETEPTLSETRAFFERYVKSHNYSQVTQGSLRLQGQEFFWGQYLMPQGVMVRKYSATVNRVEYIITCQYGLLATTTEKDIRRAERDYDDILANFIITGAATPESLNRAAQLGEGASSGDRAAKIFRVVMVCLFSAACIGAAWAGWLKFSAGLTWVWTIAGGLLGSRIVVRDARGAGAPFLLALILGLGLLVGWASILFATGVL